MNVAIVGAWNRSEAQDYKLVNDLLTALGNAYPNLWVVTFGCDRGIGKIVKNRCLSKEKGKPPEFDFLEISFHVYYANNPSKFRLAQFWQARNAMVFEACEEFHLFMDDKEKNPGSQMQDLLQRVQKTGLPHSVYHAGEVTGPKLVTPMGSPFPTS